MAMPKKQLQFFVSYSHRNMKYKEKLLVSLEALKQSFNISNWHDGMIDPGGNIDETVKSALSNSQVILLIITDDYIASHYCMDIELKEAIEREKQGKCIVIPVMFQESVLSEDLQFFHHNRVPQDGKPIATGFRNQSQGCARAVNMIKDLLSKKFPQYKKNKSKVSSTTPKQKETIDKGLYIELYKNGKLAPISLSQNMLELIPKCHKSINDFRTIMEQALVKAKREYNTAHRKYKKLGISVPGNIQLELLRVYLMDICAYTKTYVTENVGIKVHFRVSKNDYYLGLIASTDNDNSTDLAADWTTQMTPIPIYKGLIYYSSKYHAPMVKSLNIRLNFKATNDRIWKDYVTFTFPKFHEGQTPLISYCISVHKDYYSIKSDILKILAYLNFGDTVEKYIYDYCEACRNIDRSYSLEDVIKALERV